MIQKKIVIYPNEEKEDEFNKKEDVEELSGKLSSNPSDEEKKLAHSVMEAEGKKNEGDMIQESMNRGISSFTPDLTFKNITNNFKNAKKLYGETIIREMTGYDEDYIEKNVNIPEFKRTIKENINNKIKKLKKDNVLGKNGTITQKGVHLAALTICIDELDNIKSKGLFGEQFHKKKSQTGEPFDIKKFKKGHNYKDISIKSSVKTALRRGHKKLETNDLKTYDRRSKGRTCIIYALDASGSMKGKKIDVSKRAGISLAYRAIENKDKVGLIIFGDEVVEFVEPTLNFNELIDKIVQIKTSKETDFTATIEKAIEMFPKDTNITKHLIMLTDAVPTVSKEQNKIAAEVSRMNINTTSQHISEYKQNVHKKNDPKILALNSIGMARDQGITTSIIGIDLDDEGADFGRRASEIGSGKLSVVRNLNNLSHIVLEDYYSIM